MIQNLESKSALSLYANYFHDSYQWYIQEIQKKKLKSNEQQAQSRIACAILANAFHKSDSEPRLWTHRIEE